MLVGEAAGYRGARVSGIAFTSERQLTGAGPAEASATVVHRVLAELGLEDDVLLWNVVPTHPGTATSNRRPTAAEIAGGEAFLPELVRGRRVIAVGRDRGGRPRRAVRPASRTGRCAGVRRRAAAYTRRMTGAVRRNAFLLAGGLVCNSGMFQLAAALSSLTLVAVTGVTGILGLGPAIFLCSGAAAVGPAGRLMDRVGRMPVIRGGFVAGGIGCAVVAAGCHSSSAPLVCLGLALVGGAGAIVQLSRAAAAEMFPPERRARGMSFVLFGAVSGAIWGPVVFGPLFGSRGTTAHALAWPWLLGVPFMAAGFVIASRVRPDPKEIGRAHDDGADDTAPAEPLREILRRPGVITALVAAVASFAVMAGVMNLAGYVAVGRGHHQGDVFRMISVHIVGMYGLVLVVGDLIDRFGRRRALVGGLLLMALSNALLAWSGSVGGMSLALLGLGLGWNFSYVAATTELVSLAAPSERGRLVGFSDLVSSVTAAGLAIVGGLVYTASGAAALALTAAGVAALPALWLALRPARAALAFSAAD